MQPGTSWPANYTNCSDNQQQDEAILMQLLLHSEESEISP